MINTLINTPDVMVYVRTSSIENYSKGLMFLTKLYII